MREKIDKLKEDARETLTGSTPENDLRARLHADHVDVAKLLDEILSTDDEEVVVREEIRDEIAMLLTTHERAEEEVVYRFLDQNSVTRDDANHARKEHRDIDQALSRVRTMDCSDTNFLDACRELKQCVTHHVHEEENNVLPRAEKELGQERLARLIPEFNRRRAELIGRQDRMMESRMTRGLEEAPSQF